jgi:hypothetical protein
VDMRWRKPWFLARLRTFGWKVRFTFPPRRSGSEGPDRVPAAAPCADEAGGTRVTAPRGHRTTLGGGPSQGQSRGPHPLRTPPWPVLRSPSCRARRSARPATASTPAKCRSPPLEACPFVFHSMWTPL